MKDNSHEIMLDVVTKMASGELSYDRMVRELSGRLEKMEADLSNEIQQMELAKRRIDGKRGALEALKITVEYLEQYGKRLGLDRLKEVPVPGRDPETGAIKTTVVSTDTTNPEAIAFHKEVEERRGKLCLHRAGDDTDWCPTKITKKRAAKGAIYCAKHEKWEGE